MKMKLYPYYSHRVDPIMGKLVVIMKRNGTKRSAVATKANVSASTLRNWEKKKTRRPQFATVAGVGRSLGEDGVRAIVETIKRGE